MLPRAQRLVRSRDFQATYQRKRRVDHPALTLYVGRRSVGTPRLGFVVSKKVAGKAHDRNRIKRRLRALSLPLIPGLSAYDFIVVVRAPALLLEFTALRTVVVQLFQQAGVFSPASDASSPVGVINDGGE
jgi:ribonuclease P protein component